MRYLVIFVLFFMSLFTSCGGNQYDNIQKRPASQQPQRDTLSQTDSVTVYKFTHFTDDGESIHEVPVEVRLYSNQRKLVILGKNEKESPYNTFSFISDYENSSEGGVSIATLIAKHAPQGVLPMFEGKASTIGFKEFDGKIIAVFVDSRLYFNTDIPKIALPRKPISSVKKVPSYQSTDSHQVKNGETLSMISRKYNVTIEFLTRKNNLQGTTITPGQIIYIR